MITVNLLPMHLRPIKRTPLPHLGAFLVLILACAGMFQVMVMDFAKVSTQKNTFADLEAAYKFYEGTVKQYQDYESNIQHLKDKVAVIRGITQDRIIWSYQLHLLTTGIPDNIWLSGIKETIVKKLRPTPQIDPKTRMQAVDRTTGELLYTTTSVPVPMLEVSGYAIQDETMGNQVNPFIEKLEAPPFSDQFAFDGLTLEYDKIENVQVRSFTLQYEIKTGGKETDA